MRVDYDCLIVGGGLVGASLAAALVPSGLSIGVVEAKPLGGSGQPSYDDRGLALSLASARILQALGVWEGMAGRAAPIMSVHVSERGRFGFTRMQAADIGQRVLGYGVIARDLGEVLLPALARRCEYLCPAALTGLAITTDAAIATIDADGRSRMVRAGLLIGADGADSAARRLLGLEARQSDYGQVAVVANVTPGIHPGTTAYERFTSAGPLALLPLPGERAALVQTVAAGDAPALLALGDEAFAAQAAACFGGRFGTFRAVGRRGAHRLRRLELARTTGARFAIIGNAAHVVHPNAAQGFNLGLRDAAALAEHLIARRGAGLDIGDAGPLAAYARARRPDQRRVMALTHGLARLFYNDLPPLVVLRNAAMVALDLLPPAKRALARQGIGFAGRPPGFAGGVAGR
jgi:2-octaprenyl-6-methoxyphenol hydroxylase